jgi:hypothetical protein
MAGVEKCKEALCDAQPGSSREYLVRELVYLWDPRNEKGADRCPKNLRGNKD